MCFRDISAKFCLFMGLVKIFFQTSYIMVCIRPWHIAKRERLALFKTCTFSFKWIIIKINLGIAFKMEHSIVNLIYHKCLFHLLVQKVFSPRSKGYLPNLLETTLSHQIFVCWVRDFKLRLLAYFFIFFECAKFQQVWTTLILDIL